MTQNPDTSRVQYGIDVPQSYVEALDAAKSVDPASLTKDFLSQYFAVIDGPSRAYYETHDGVIARFEDVTGDEPSPNALIERGIYRVYGVGITNEGDNGTPVEEHGLKLWEAFHVFLEETRKACQASGQLTYVQRRAPVFETEEYHVFDKTAAAYSVATFTEMRKQAIQAHQVCTDEFSAAQAHAVDGYALDPEAGSYRKVLGTYQRSRITIRGHFRGLGDSVKNRFFKAEGDPVVMNVVLPLTAFPAGGLVDPDSGATVRPIPA